MDGEPEDILCRMVYENMMATEVDKQKDMQIGAALMGVYGSIISSGGEGQADINEIISDMQRG